MEFFQKRNPNYCETFVEILSNRELKNRKQKTEKIEYKRKTSISG